MLNFYRKLIELRRAEPALPGGSYAPITAEGALLAYTRGAGAEALVIALNLGSSPATLRMPPHQPLHGRIALSTRLDRHDEEVAGSLHLRANEGIIVSFRPRAAVL